MFRSFVFTIGTYVPLQSRRVGFHSIKIGSPHRRLTEEATFICNFFLLSSYTTLSWRVTTCSEEHPPITSAIRSSCGQAVPRLVCHTTRTYTLPIHRTHLVDGLRTIRGVAFEASRPRARCRDRFVDDNGGRLKQYHVKYE